MRFITRINDIARGARKSIKPLSFIREYDFVLDFLRKACHIPVRWPNIGRRMRNPMRRFGSHSSALSAPNGWSCERFSERAAPSARDAGFLSLNEATRQGTRLPD